MSGKTLLQVNSSGRYQGSVTRQVSELVVDYLQQQNPALESIHRDVAPGLPFVDEAWINANFTAAEERTGSQKEVLSFSDTLVQELQDAQHIVIAAPIYNFNIPAVLKAWIDLVARAGLTFRYTENGPVGLLDNKKATVVVASGGTPIGSAMDMASSYLKLALGFIGIHDVAIIDTSKINYGDDANGQFTAADNAMAQIAALVN